jgi:hypothetical protein
MAAYREKVGPQLPGGEGHLAESLDGVAVQEGPGRPAFHGGPELFQGVEVSELVVDEHAGNQDGFGGQRLLKAVEIDPAARKKGERRDRKAPLFKAGEGI